MAPEFADYGASLAVLIGVSRYVDPSFPDIPAAANSLNDVHAMLTDPQLCGWPQERVVVIRDPQHAGKLAQRLRRLAEQTSGVFLLYFVGHGTLTPSAELCLTLSDTEDTDPDLTGLEYSRVKKVFLGSPARLRVAILDCCYSGRAIEALSAVDQQIADSTEVRGVYTLTASDRAAHVVPRSMQANERTSFTGELVDLVRDGIPGGFDTLTLGAIYLHLRQRLAARNLPAPNHRGTDTAGSFAFARNAAAQRLVIDSNETPVPGSLASPSSQLPAEFEQPNGLWQPGQHGLFARIKAAIAERSDPTAGRPASDPQRNTNDDRDDDLEFELFLHLEAMAARKRRATIYEADPRETAKLHQMLGAGSWLQDSDSMIRLIGRVQARDEGEELYSPLLDAVGRAADAAVVVALITNIRFAKRDDDAATLLHAIARYRPITRLIPVIDALRRAGQLQDASRVLDSIGWARGIDPTIDVLDALRAANREQDAVKVLESTARCSGAQARDLERVLRNQGRAADADQVRKILIQSGIEPSV